MAKSSHREIRAEKDASDEESGRKDGAADG